ncbi:DUF4230 domain-containing protein [Peribacillus huizhouensis]|uniref:DUF4230 domain-containing protein n=1 Tax=Peribacillus huizhouensis TaxID=1501239 RepID=A0ABR6CRK1_9BACI|nr:DUF4230 domain-containing protein [Peribacillus huizhouensis]MBA9027551.1 hypothetical protein [Peribacillus huizhouensis]
MFKKTAAIVILTSGIVLYASNAIGGSETAAPAPTPAPIILHEATVISALRSEARIVAPTGKVTKTISQQDENFWGHRVYKMTVNGSFVLGVDTQDIVVSVEGNTITVRMPQPKVVSLDLPYDEMTLTEQKSLLRKELPDDELKALYTKAEKAVRKDIAQDRDVQAKAERQMEQAVEQIIVKINGVSQVIFQ